MSKISQLCQYLPNKNEFFFVAGCCPFNPIFTETLLRMRKLPFRDIAGDVVRADVGTTLDFR